MSRRTTISIGLSIVGFIGMIAILIGFALNRDIRSSNLVIPLYVSFIMFYFSERVSSILTDVASDKETQYLRREIEESATKAQKLREDIGCDLNNIHEILNQLPSLLAGRHDITSFASEADGLRHAINLANMAIEVKNTVLRYGIKSSLSPYGDLYKKWIETKRESIQSSRACGWMEIVSTHLSDEDPQRIFMNEVAESAKYEKSFIDDINHPMIQMAIFSYSDGSREIMLGHSFPRIKTGTVFITKNDAIIQYFERYYMYWFDRGVSEPKIPVTE